jgi:hypothetical protein
MTMNIALVRKEVAYYHELSQHSSAATEENYINIRVTVSWLHWNPFDD